MNKNQIKRKLEDLEGGDKVLGGIMELIINIETIEGCADCGAIKKEGKPCPDCGCVERKQVGFQYNK